MRETDGDDAKQRDNKGLDPAEAEVLHPQNEEHVERGQDQHAISSGMPNSRLSPIAVPITSARSVAQMAISAISHSGTDTARGNASRHACARSRPGRDAKPRAQRLQDNRHDVRHQRDGEQRAAKLGAARERGRPVARVHIADGNEVTGPRRRQHAFPERAGRTRGNSAENFRKRGAGTAAAANRAADFPRISLLALKHSWPNPVAPEPPFGTGLPILYCK